MQRLLSLILRLVVMKMEREKRGEDETKSHKEARRRNSKYFFADPGRVPSFGELSEREGRIGWV